MVYLMSGESSEFSERYVEELATDFSMFARDILKVDIQPFHQEWVDIYDGNARSGIRAPRGFGKSTVLGVWYPIWKIRFSEWHGHPWTFCVMSDSLPQSGNIVGALRRTLESNPFLRDLVPPPASTLHYKERKLELTDGSVIHCVPYSRTAVGIHVHRFLFDECTKVPDAKLFWEDLTPIVNHYDGHICGIGTPDHVNDTLEQMESKSEYKCTTYKSIREDGSPLWIEKFPLEKLEEIKAREGLTSFMRNYMCTLTASGTQVFPPQDIAAVCDKSHSFEAAAKKGWSYFTGVDLAISPKGDYTVVTTVGSTPEGRLKIVDMRRAQGNDYGVQLQIVKDVYATYKPMRVLVDESLFGIPFINDLIQKNYVPAEGYNFQPAKRMVIINNMMRLFPKLLIPTNQTGGFTGDMMNELCHELSGFIFSSTRTGLRTFESTTEHDDAVMSLALALFAAGDTIYSDSISSSSSYSLQTSNASQSDDFFEDGVDISAIDDILPEGEELI